jgi:hypothetical protein
VSQGKENYGNKPMYVRVSLSLIFSIEKIHEPNSSGGGVGVRSLSVLIRGINISRFERYLSNRRYRTPPATTLVMTVEMTVVVCTSGE